MFAESQGQFSSAAASLRPAADWGVGNGQMRSGHMRGILQFIRVRGGNPIEMLDRSGIALSVMNDPDELVRCDAMVDMLEECAVQLDDPLFGMRFGLTQSVDVFGSVSALGRAAPTVSDGLDCFVEYLPLMHSSEGMLEIRRAERHSELGWVAEGRFADNRQGNYQSAVLQIKILRMLGGASLKPSYVMLIADVPRSCRDELQQQLGCRVVGGSDRNAIGFDARALDWPVQTSSRMIHALIEGHLRTIRASSRPNLIERVQSFIDKALPTGRCSLRMCAAAMGTSPRTLQVRLDAAGESFTDMVEQRRAEIARHLITVGDLSMIEIAGLLGYAEQSSFSRAFRRWHGASPQKVRAELTQ